MEKFINAMLFVVFRESDVDFGEVDSGRCVLLSKKSWKRKECDGCKSYNPECWMSVCSIYPYQKQRETEVKKIEVHDTG